MQNVLGNTSTKTITDATGCVGGDTIQFGLNFKSVDTIEINKNNFEALKNNVAVYNLKNIKLYLGDATDLYNWKTDVLYIDPPWGGPNYREVKELDLLISATRLDIWLEQILLRKNRPSYIFLKLPTNYNFKRLNFLSNVDFIKPYRIRGYILIAITVHMPRI
jgi:predicted RNA methylase